MISLSDGLMLSLSQAFATRFAGGFIRIFTGAAAATPNDVESGTLLGIISLNGDGTGLQFAPSNGYVGIPVGVRWGYTGLAAGDAGHFRLVAPSDTGAVSPTEPRISGTIGVAASGSDMEWDAVAVAAGATYTLDSFNYIVHPIPRT